MTSGDSFHAAGRAQSHPFRRGDVVRIVRGSLVDAIGIVVEVSADNRFALSIAGQSEGVLVVVEAASIQPADPLSFAEADIPALPQ